MAMIAALGVMMLAMAALAACTPAKADSPLTVKAPVHTAVLKSDLSLTPAQSESKYAYVVSASGYPGGNFDVGETEEKLPNPIDAVIRVLADVTNSGIKYDLCAIEAGADALTAPTEAMAIIAVNDYEQRKALQVFESSAKEFSDMDVSVAITQTVVPGYAVSADDASKVVTQLSSLTGNDFTQDNEGLSGVFTGRVSLKPDHFVCDVSIIGSDAQAVDRVSGECIGIEALSGIPLQRVT